MANNDLCLRIGVGQVRTQQSNAEAWENVDGVMCLIEDCTVRHRMRKGKESLCHQSLKHRNQGVSRRFLDKKI